MRVVVCWVMRLVFALGGFHQLKVKGEKATTKDAPILALAPHSSFIDALPVVYLGGPSIVAKAEVGRIPFFGSTFIIFYIRITGPSFLIFRFFVFFFFYNSVLSLSWTPNYMVDGIWSLTQIH